MKRSTVSTSCPRDNSLYCNELYEGWTAVDTVDGTSLGFVIFSFLGFYDLPVHPVHEMR